MTDSLQIRRHESAGEPPDRWEPPTLWGLLMGHKRIAAALVVIFAILLAIVLPADLSSKLSRIADSTPCSVWSSANEGQRAAYAARYVKEHGPLPSGASDASTIEGVIDDGCTAAYSFDEADTVTVLQSIKKEY